MPANPTSRYRQTLTFVDDRSSDESDSAGVVFFGQRRPIRFQDDVDTVAHLVSEGDTLQMLANTHYQGFPDPSSLWWVIAEFQPIPILDPTRRLGPGKILMIPSATLVSRLLHGTVTVR